MGASPLIWLEGVEGSLEHGQRFPLAFGRAFTFGRSRDNDYTLHGHHVSRVHFQVTWSGCGLHVRPFWHRYPLSVNGRPVPEEGARVCPGDLLTTANVRLRVEAARPKASTRVLQILRAIREGGDYASLPILADALEEDGFDTHEVLQHCREANHDASCWVLGLQWGL